MRWIRLRSFRWAGVVVAAAVAVAVAVIVLVVGRGDDTEVAPAPPVSSESSRSAHRSPTPTVTVSIPPKPDPVTMRVVRRVGSAQEFRRYTGPRLPAFTKADALRRVDGPGAYSLGLWDVGMVRRYGLVDWHPVWIIANVAFVEDFREIEIGGTLREVEPTPDKPRPGWLRSVTMINATTGKFVLGYSF